MARNPINYQKNEWGVDTYVNPYNMGHQEDGVKAACDGVDELFQETDDLDNRVKDLEDASFDDHLDPESTNAVQNKVIKEALDNIKVDTDEELDPDSTNPIANKAVYAALQDFTTNEKVTYEEWVNEHQVEDNTAYFMDDIPAEADDPPEDEWNADYIYFEDPEFESRDVHSAIIEAKEKGGGITTDDDAEVTDTVPRDADTFNGQFPEYYATKEQLDQTNTNLNSLIIRRRFSVPQTTIGANSNVVITLKDFSIPDGYEILSYLASTLVSGVITGDNLNSNGGFRAYNVSSSSKTTPENGEMLVYFVKVN